MANSAKTYSKINIRLALYIQGVNVINAYNFYHVENVNYDAVVEKDEVRIIQYLVVNVTRNINEEY